MDDATFVRLIKERDVYNEKLAKEAFGKLMAHIRLKIDGYTPDYEI